MNRLSNNYKSWIWFIMGFASVFLAQFIFQAFFVFTGCVFILIGLYYTFKNSVVFQAIIRLKKRLFNEK